MIYKYILLIILYCSIAFAQQSPFEIKQYDFINYDENIIESYDDVKLQNFFDKLDNVVLRGKDKLNIMQIGDSHIQGGYISNQIRQRLQSFIKVSNSERGFLFPYSLVKTNNPQNYSIRYTGSWKGCRNVERKKKCDLGVAGIAATTWNSSASVTVKLNPPQGLNWDFNRIRVFHNENTSYIVFPKKSSVNEKSQIKRYEHYTEIILNDYTTEVTIQFQKSDVGTEDKFTLYGISLENDSPGIAYHTAGVNGAEVSSYLRCNLFTEHLEDISPDMVIISLGTNDAYVKVFDKEEFKAKYDTLITIIKEAAPNTAVILATPGDNYRYRRYVNRNNSVAVEAIHELAEEKNLSVWDFYEVMGGFRSVSKWYRMGLTARDRLHYSKSGYELQGDLFFNAFIKSYDKHIESKFTKMKNKIKRY